MAGHRDTVARHGHAEIDELSGQKLLPVIELDGEAYRAESDEMAERVRSGSLRAA